MNRIEERLTEALGSEAERVEVDTDRMWSALRTRTVDARPEPSTERSPRGRGLVPYLAAAAVVAVLVPIGVALADSDDPNGGGDPAATTETPLPTKKPKPVGGPVASSIGAWACPHQTVLSMGADSITGKPLRVVLDPTEVPEEATQYAVPRYRFTLGKTTGSLEYGDPAGRRVSRTELTKGAAGWQVGKRTVCSSANGRPSPAPDTLGRHTKIPVAFDRNSPQLKALPATGQPLLLDDRTYYDAAGLLRQTTLYAYPVKNGYQFARFPADDWGYRSDVIPEAQISGDSGSPSSSGTSKVTPFADYTRNIGGAFTYLTKDPDVTGLKLTHPSKGTTGPTQHFTFSGGRTLYTAVPTSFVDGDTLVTVQRRSGDEPPARF